jgi:plasmid stabilization system protein ParE
MDIAIILARAEENFGAVARQRYEALIGASLRAIAADPFQLGSAARPEIGECVRTYHLRRARAGEDRRPRAHPQAFSALSLRQPGYRWCWPRAARGDGT